MESFNDLRSIEINNYTIIHYNKVTKYFAHYNEVPDLGPFQAWGQFGMTLNTAGPIVKFIIENAPPDTAIACCMTDYNFPIPPSISKFFKKCLQIVRYQGVPNSIVVPGDDIFFEDPTYYNPKIDIPFEKRSNTVFWRGSCTNGLRKDVVMALRNMENTDVRLIHSQSWADTYWNERPELFGSRCNPDEYTKHKIWLSIEGWGCASDTTRALMSGCAVIYCRLTAPWFDKFLIHGENCMIVDANDRDELKNIITKLLHDTEFTQKIAENGKRTADNIFQPDFYKKFILDQLIE